MPVPLLDLKAQHQTIRDTVLSAIMPVIEEQSFILGETVAQFEHLVATLSNTKHAIGVANGTDALLLALRALDVGHGDLVITTPFTFFATAGAIHNVGARPVFVDIDPGTFNINPEAVSAAVEKYPNVKAVVVVDLFGQMAPIEEIRARIPAHIPIVEDAAQSIGAQRRLKNGQWIRAGELADIGTFSFFPSKNLGGYGDGGMIVTQRDDLEARIRRLRTHGGTKTYYHEEVGFNSRLDSLQAAILMAKLPNLESWSDARRKNASFYDEAFSSLEEVQVPQIDSQNVSIYNQYTIRTPDRDALRQTLNEKGIGNCVYYPLPLHLQKCFSYLGYQMGDFPESERAAREVLSLPVYPELSEAQKNEVVEGVTSFWKK